MERDMERDTAYEAEVERLAAEVYDYVLANAKTNVSKDPRKMGEPWANIKFDEVRYFYRNIAKWYLSKEG